MLFLLSCNKDCKDNNLSMERINYSGDEIRTNGYYYYVVRSEFDPKISYQLLFIYRNGTVFQNGGAGQTLNDVEKHISDGSLHSMYHDHKPSWGLYRVFNDSISVEQWGVTQCGGHPTYNYPLKIINDTTLLMKSNDTFVYREFTPKLDSINDFIK